MRVLIACEESQTICLKAREFKIDAFSCDILPCSGGKPEFHIQTNVLEIINDNWDLIIAHPPCTYLTVTGNKWMKPEFKKRFPLRENQRKQAIQFFMKIAKAKCKKIEIENPVGIISTVWRKPDQYIQPYFFGEPQSKKTGLWLKGLPLLKPTNIVEPKMYIYKDGRRDPIWHVETMSLPKEERTKQRSKTFNSVAEQMVKQWMI